MEVHSIFETIQGEGRFVGEPCVFLRLSGCNKKCDFCDTEYHINGKEMKVDDVVKEINKFKKTVVVVTGGEPLLQWKELKQLINMMPIKLFKLETNGSIDIKTDFQLFSFICFSPKDKKDMEQVKRITQDVSTLHYDIKVVTDLIINKELIPDATILMPLTFRKRYLTNITKQQVWDYCVKNDIKYSPRIHQDVWRGVKGR